MSTSSPEPDRLWTIQDVSQYLGVSVSTLYAWRCEGKGPEGRRIGKHVRYRPDDVRAWFTTLPVGVAS